MKMLISYIMVRKIIEKPCSNDISKQGLSTPSGFALATNMESLVGEGQDLFDGSLALISL